MEEANLITVTYPVRGMSCSACASSVQSKLNSVVGVKHASVNYATNSVKISYDPDIVNPDDIKKAVVGIGYDLLLSPSTSKDSLILKYKVYISLILAIPILIISMIFQDMHYRNWTMLFLSLPVLLWAGKDFYINAWKKFLDRKTNMDTLVTLGTGSAFLFSLFNTLLPEILLERGFEAHVYYETAVIVIGLLLFGRHLEERAKDRTTNAIKSLLNLQPSEATVFNKGKEEVIPADDLQPGDEFIVKPGDRIPADAIVLSGASSVQESMITGESLAAEKTTGSRVIAGTINEAGFLKASAEKTGADTTLSKIIQIMEGAQGRKIPIQQFADRTASIFVPIVLVIAFFTFWGWVFFGPEPVYAYAFVTTITVLIIACPCALGLATPTAIFMGIGKGAEQGILIRDGSALETLDILDVLIIDKTGTLTEGKPTVAGAVWAPDPGPERDELASIIAAIERRATHPLAGAVNHFFSKNQPTDIEIENFKNIGGKGIIGTVDGTVFLAGNLHFMEEYSIDIPDSLRQGTDILHKEGMPVVVCARESKAFLVLGVKDSLRKESKDAILNLQLRGIQVVMATGDHKAAAEKIAFEAGISVVYSELMPHEKGEIVRKYQAKGMKVGLAGDGVNDAGALAVADVGISLSGSTDLAIESSALTLLNGNVSKILYAIELSGKTLKIIRENLFWAFIFNLIAIPIAAGLLYPFNGFLFNPMIAVAAMVFSSIFVVLNGLRIKDLSS